MNLKLKEKTQLKMSLLVAHYYTHSLIYCQKNLYSRHKNKIFIFIKIQLILTIYVQNPIALYLFTFKRIIKTYKTKNKYDLTNNFVEAQAYRQCDHIFFVI